MINLKYFIKGIVCSKKFDSPAIALGASFIAIGALLKNLGFNIQESIFSTFLTYALPGSLVMAESMLIGASLINIFLAVWLVNSRLFPMTVSIMPLLKHDSQPRWKYYISCHFVAVSSWLILKNNYEEIDRKHRIDFWIGIGTATWLIAIFFNSIRILCCRLFKQRYDNWTCYSKSNLFYVCNDRSYENYTTFLCNYPGCNFGSHFLFFFTRMECFTWWVGSWFNCLLYRRGL